MQTRLAQSSAETVPIELAFLSETWKRKLFGSFSVLLFSFCFCFCPNIHSPRCSTNIHSELYCKIIATLYWYNTFTRRFIKHYKQTNSYYPKWLIQRAPSYPLRQHRLKPLNTGLWKQNKYPECFLHFSSWRKSILQCTERETPHAYGSQKILVHLTAGKLSGDVPALTLPGLCPAHREMWVKAEWQEHTLCWVPLGSLVPAQHSFQRFLKNKIKA